MKSENGLRLKRGARIIGWLLLAGFMTYVASATFPMAMSIITTILPFILVVMLVIPPKMVLRSRKIVLVLLAITLMGAYQASAGIKIQEEEKLANLKIFSPETYVDKLKSLGRDDEWFAALKDIRPEEYAVEKARRDEIVQWGQLRKEKQARIDRVKQLYKRAGDEGRNGITLKASDYEGTWNLIVTEGRLTCEQGPVYKGTPRPYVLFEAKGKTYGVNGAAMGKGGYPDARTLLAGEAGEAPYVLKMLDLLVNVGSEMCKATITENCGGEFTARRAAVAYVQSRLKSPSTADFPLLDLRYAMLECGVWSVKSYVDSQNTYGATIRTNFSAIVERKADGTWKPIDLQFLP